MSKKIITAITGIALLVGGGAANAQIWVDSQGTSVDDANIDSDNRGARDLLKGTDLNRGLDVGSLKIINSNMKQVAADLKDLFGDQDKIVASCPPPPSDTVYNRNGDSGNDLKLNHYTRTAGNYGWGGQMVEGDDISPNTWIVSGGDRRTYQKYNHMFIETKWMSNSGCIAFNCGGGFVSSSLLNNTENVRNSAEEAVAAAISRPNGKSVIQTSIRLSVDVDLMSGYSIKAKRPDEEWVTPASVDLSSLTGDLGPSRLLTTGSSYLVSPLRVYNGAVFSPFKFNHSVPQMSLFTMSLDTGSIHGQGVIQEASPGNSWLTQQMQIKSVEHVKSLGKFTDKIKLSIKMLKSGGANEYGSQPLSEYYGGYAVNNAVEAIGTFSTGNEFSGIWALPSGKGLKYTGPVVVSSSTLASQLKTEDNALKTITCTLMAAP